jgi:hypothetical protein
MLLKAAAAKPGGAVFGRPRSCATRLPASAAAARAARAAPPPRPPRAASPCAAPRPPAPPAGRTARRRGVSAVRAPRLRAGGADRVRATVAAVPAALAGARAPGTSSSVHWAALPLDIPTWSRSLMGREPSCCRQRRPGWRRRQDLCQTARQLLASWCGALTACRARSLRPTSSARSARDGPPSNLPLACLTHIAGPTPSCPLKKHMQPSKTCRCPPALGKVLVCDRGLRRLALCATRRQRKLVICAVAA